MKLRTILEEIDFKNLEATIKNFEQGTVSRDRFLGYLRNQLEQAKLENQQMQKQIEAARNAAKMAAKNTQQTKNQGIGNTKEVNTPQSNTGSSSTPISNT